MLHFSLIQEFTPHSRCQHIGGIGRCNGRYRPFNLCMTQCQDEFRSLSGSVTEILTACRMLQISIAWCQIEAEIRGFPTMYIIGGVNMVKIGEKHDFVQILGLKTPISSDRNFEHLTSEGSVA